MIFLGDILDGQTAVLNNQELCITNILTASQNVPFEMLYCFGNHCHYSFSRSDLYEKLIPGFLKNESNHNENSINNNKYNSNTNSNSRNAKITNDNSDTNKNNIENSNGNNDEKFLIKLQLNTENTDKTVGGNCSTKKLYYDYSPYKNWRFISLGGCCLFSRLLC